MTVVMPAMLVIIAGMVMPLPAQTVSEQMAIHAQAAREAQQRNDFATAVHEYEYLTRQLPHSIEMQSNLGVALYFHHEWARTIAVLGRVSALNPNLLAPHLFSGLAWYQLSNPDAAVPELEKAVQTNPADVIAQTWLGYSYVAQSRYEDAVKQFQSASRIEPNNIDVWYALGQSYLQIGLEATRELLTVAPDGGRAWQLAGEQSLLGGDSRKALKDFEEASRRRPDIRELRTLLVSLGGTPADRPAGEPNGNSMEDNLYQRAHDAEQNSRTAFERVAQIAPDSYRAHQISAGVLAAEQQSDKAVQEYRTVLELKPDLPGIHESLGSSLVVGGKLAEALKEFQAEIQIQPHSATAHTNAGRVLLMMGNEAEAGKMLTAALGMDRPPLEIYFLLGKLELQRYNYHAAISALTHYLSTEKDASSAYYLLAKAYRGIGDREQMNRALDLYKKTSKEVKAHSPAQTELARLSGKNQVKEDDTDLKDTSTTSESR